MAGDPTGRISHLPEMHRGVAWKEPVRCASTANVTVASGVESGDSLDGITLATGDRILLKDQTVGFENGIYTVNASGPPTRTFDMDQDATNVVPASEVMGAIVYVIAGTVNGGSFWRNTNVTPPTLGVTALTFTQFGVGAAFAVPAIVLGTADAAGSAVTVIRSDATILAFDATAPVTAAIGDSAAIGSAAVAARRDHRHGMPTFGSPVSVGTANANGSATTIARSDHVHQGASTTTGQILISDTPGGSPLVFGDLIQNEAGTDLVYADS